jgi:hypothetical protein
LVYRVAAIRDNISFEKLPELEVKEKSKDKSEKSEKEKKPKPFKK